jgi:quercetin dioxygenase-like cupin family protein
MRLTTISLGIAFAAIMLACSATNTATEIPGPQLNWMPAPAVFPPGALMAVLDGDPSKTTEFTVRLKMPDGYRVPPHTHPTDEHVTVISGAFKVGMGRTFVADSMLTLGTGGFATAPAGHPHFAAAQGTTIVQVHALGPFAMTYVNSNDTPRAAPR